MDRTAGPHAGEDPTPHQLRLFLVVAEELHFGRAATRAHLSQPALSQQIRALEHRLGVPLFERTSRRVDLTSAARELLPVARSIVAETDRLRTLARRARAGLGALRLGVCESFGTLAAVRDVIGELSRLAPDFAPEIRVFDAFADQVAALERGEVDAGFAHLPVPAALRAVALFHERRFAVLAAADPLAGRASLRLADLAGRRAVTTVPDSFPEGRAFWAPGGAVAPNRSATFESLLTTVALTGAVAYVPASAARLYPRPDLRYVPVEDLAECAFAAIWRADKGDDPRIVVLADVVGARVGR